MASSAKFENRDRKVDVKSDAMLLEVLDETLEEVFKGVGVQVIYASFEKNFQLRREDIMRKPDMFSSGLESLLGSAAVVIEKLIIKNLYRKAGLEYVETENCQFSNVINELRRKMSSIEEKKTNENSRMQESKTETHVEDASSSSVEAGAGTNSTQAVDYLQLCEGILENMQIGIDVWHLENADDSSKLTFVFSNSIAEQMTGVSRKTVIGKTLAEAFPQMLGTEFPKLCTEAIRSGRSMALGKTNYGNERAPGNVCSVRLFPLPGNCIGVTLEKLNPQQTQETLREEDGRFRNLVETAPIAIYTISAEKGTITSLNPAFEKITGWQRSEWLGKSFMAIVHPDDLSAAIETFRKTLSGEDVPPYELRVRSKSGEILDRGIYEQTSN